MRKAILAILGTALIAGATVQFAAAAERHHSKKAVRVPAPASDQFRNSNAAWPTQQEQSYWSRYSGVTRRRPVARSLARINPRPSNSLPQREGGLSVEKSGQDRDDARKKRQQQHEADHDGQVG